MVFRTFILTAIVAAGALIPATAFAQYPPPDGNLTITVVDSNTVVKVTATDAAGSPVAGAVVSATVAGTGASISPASATTNSQGQAVFTLIAGTGSVTVSATSGELTAQVVVPDEAPSPPDTGKGTLSPTSDSFLATVFGTAAVMVLLAAGGIAVVSRRP